MKPNLINNYTTKAGVYDEFLNSDNTPRSIASALLNRLSTFDEEEIENRQRRLNNMQYYKPLVQTKLCDLSVAVQSDFF